jgi:hypothetical protein
MAHRKIGTRIPSHVAKSSRPAIYGERIHLVFKNGIVNVFTMLVEESLEKKGVTERVNKNKYIKSWMLDAYHANNYRPNSSDFDFCFFCLAHCSDPRDYLYIQRKNVVCCEKCADKAWDRMLELKDEIRTERGLKV